MGGCVVIARNRPHARPEPIDAGDGGVFAAIGLSFFAFLVMLGVAAAVGRWFGAGASELTFELGVAVILIGTLGRIVRGGRR
jgi:hypothetical protein